MRLFVYTNFAHVPWITKFQAINRDVFFSHDIYKVIEAAKSVDDVVILAERDSSSKTWTHTGSTIGRELPNALLVWSSNFPPAHTTGYTHVVPEGISTQQALEQLLAADDPMSILANWQI